ncbi:MAG TPA: hypothetical protein VHS76_00835 [Steroidobacteraceae bacterium]|nr:hypothetical protein [Steroidobacteraceae bacterium]
MILRLTASVLVLIILALLGAAPARAEPYLAVQTGYKCNVCHVNPTGGGLRNDFGITYAKVLLPAETLDNTVDAWTGKVLDRLRVGGDLRADWSRETAPNSPSQQSFALEQFRVYADLTIIPNRLGIYVDEQVAPNGSQNEEAYVRYGSTTDGFYVKGGQFYLPFGWRLQDQTAFVRQVTGINMTTPDKGVEVGYEHKAWSAQFDVTNGAANATTGSGYQVVTQVVYTKPIWRVGIAGSSTSSSAGDRRMGGLFAGLKTGPIAWLAEGDIVHDDSVQRSLAAGLLEGDWRILKGHNLKLTAEYEDPDRAVRNNQQTRYSIVYEYTPLPFLQLRAGYRHNFGIPQNNDQHLQLTFVELHGYF